MSLVVLVDIGSSWQLCKDLLGMLCWILTTVLHPRRPDLVLYTIDLAEIYGSPQNWFIGSTFYKWEK